MSRVDDLLQSTVAAIRAEDHAAAARFAEEGIAHLEHAPPDHEDRWRFLLFAGEACMQLRQFDQAMFHLARAVTASARFPNRQHYARSVASYGHTQVFQDKHSEALPRLFEAESILGQYPECRGQVAWLNRDIAKCLAATGRSSSAAESFLKAADLFRAEEMPRLVYECFRNAAKARLDAGQVKEGAECFRRALAEYDALSDKPRDEYSLLLEDYSLCLERSGQLDAAVNDWECKAEEARASGDVLREFDMRYRAGRACWDRKRLQQAEQIYLQLVDLCRTNWPSEVPAMEDYVRRIRQQIDESQASAQPSFAASQGDECPPQVSASTSPAAPLPLRLGTISEGPTVSPEGPIGSRVVQETEKEADQLTSSRERVDLWIRSASQLRENGEEGWAAECGFRAWRLALEDCEPMPLIRQARKEWLDSCLPTLHRIRHYIGQFFPDLTEVASKDASLLITRAMDARSPNDATESAELFAMAVLTRDPPVEAVLGLSLTSGLIRKTRIAPAVVYALNPLSALGLMLVRPRVDFNSLSGGPWSELLDWAWQQWESSWRNEGTNSGTAIVALAALAGLRGDEDCQACLIAAATSYLSFDDQNLSHFGHLSILSDGLRRPLTTHALTLPVGWEFLEPIVRSARLELLSDDGGVLSESESEPACAAAPPSINEAPETQASSREFASPDASTQASALQSNGGSGELLIGGGFGLDLDPQRWQLQKQDDLTWAPTDDTEMVLKTPESDCYIQVCSDEHYRDLFDYVYSETLSLIDDLSEVDVGHLERTSTDQHSVYRMELKGLKDSGQVLETVSYFTTSGKKLLHILCWCDSTDKDTTADVFSDLPTHFVWSSDEPAYEADSHRTGFRKASVPFDFTSLREGWEDRSQNSDCDLKLCRGGVGAMFLMVSSLPGRNTPKTIGDAHVLALHPLSRDGHPPTVILDEAITVDGCPAQRRRIRTWFEDVPFPMVWDTVYFSNGGRDYRVCLHTPAFLHDQMLEEICEIRDSIRWMKPATPRKKLTKSPKDLALESMAKRAETRHLMGAGGIFAICTFVCLLLGRFFLWISDAWGNSAICEIGGGLLYLATSFILAPVLGVVSAILAALGIRAWVGSWAGRGTQATDEIVCGLCGRRFPAFRVHAYAFRKKYYAVSDSRVVALKCEACKTELCSHCAKGPDQRRLGPDQREGDCCPACQKPWCVQDVSLSEG